MIIPEITNSKLKKNIFIKQFNNLLLDEKSNNKQIEDVNRAISKIELLKPPFEIAVEGIKNFFEIISFSITSQKLIFFLWFP